MNHQMAILPDETVAFYAYGANGCDDVKERAPNGTVKTVANSKTALGISDSMCHLNNIQYSKEDDSLVFSNLQSSQIAKVKRSDGSRVWVMNGSTATITGITWSGGNHGIHLLGLDHLLIFNNNNGGYGRLRGAGVHVQPHRQDRDADLVVHGQPRPAQHGHGRHSAHAQRQHGRLLTPRAA